MNPKRLAPVLALFFIASAAFAQEAVTVTITPSAPASYSAAKPAYLYFKKITITRKSKTTYVFDLTLQGEIPIAYSKELGVRYKIYFDFDGVQVSNPEISKNPNFADDMIVDIYRNPGAQKFQPWLSSLEIRHHVYEVKITELGLDKDTISLTVQSPLFAKDIQTNVLFSSGLLRGGKDRGGQNTKPVDLNTGKPVASSDAAPADEKDDTDSSPSLNSLIKP